MEEIVRQVVRLIDQGKSILSLELGTDLEPLLERMESYLSSFQDWQNNFEKQRVNLSSLSAEQSQALRSHLEELSKIHEDIATRLASNKNDLTEELGDIHKRGKALKAYVDRFPQRITIAGKREG